MMKKIGFLFLSLSASCILLIVMMILFSVLPEPISLTKVFPSVDKAYKPLGIGMFWFAVLGIAFLIGEVVRDRITNKEDRYYERNVEK